jgi:multidrug efflux pump subunit AcrA (membrane-fusion protein)
MRLSDKVEQNQLSLALQRYFQVKLSQKLLTTFDQLRQRLIKIDNISRTAIQAGTAPAYTQLGTQSALAELNARIEEARSKSEVLRMAMASLVGQINLTDEDFTSPLKVVDIPMSPDYWTQLALQRRPEFKIIDKEEKRAESLRDAAQGSLLPKFYAFGKYELLKDQLTALEPEWAVGIGMSWSLTAGFQSVPEKRRAAILKQKVNVTRNRASRDIPVQFDEVDMKAAAARAKYKAAKAKYKMGMKGARDEQKKAAQALVNQAETGLAEIKAYEKDLDIVAPADGEIAKIYAQPGELVPQGYPIITLLQKDNTWFSFYIREDRLGSFRMGQVLDVNIPALNRQHVKARVQYLSVLPSVATYTVTRDRSTFDLKTFELRLVPEEDIPHLRPGMSLILHRKRS